MLVYRCHKKDRYSQEISRKLIEELELCVVFYSVRIELMESWLMCKLGQIIESNISRIVNNEKVTDVSWIKIICLIISFAIYFIDTSSLLKPYLPKAVPPEVSYDEARKIDPNVR